MSFADKFNKGSQFNVNTDGLKYVGLSFLHANYPNQIFRILAIYLNTKGSYGTQPSVIIDNAIVNLPEHCTAVAEMILADKEAVQDIKDGKVGFHVYEYTCTNKKALGKKCYSIRYEDVNPDDTFITVEVPE